MIENSVWSKKQFFGMTIVPAIVILLLLLILFLSHPGIGRIDMTIHIVLLVILTIPLSFVYIFLSAKLLGMPKTKIQDTEYKRWGVFSIITLVFFSIFLFLVIQISYYLEFDVVSTLILLGNVWVLFSMIVYIFAECYKKNQPLY